MRSPRAVYREYIATGLHDLHGFMMLRMCELCGHRERVTQNRDETPGGGRAVMFRNVDAPLNPIYYIHAFMVAMCPSLYALHSSAPDPRH